MLCASCCPSFGWSDYGIFFVEGMLLHQHSLRCRSRRNNHLCRPQHGSTSAVTAFLEKQIIAIGPSWRDTLRGMVRLSDTSLGMGWHAICVE